jgi:DNA replication and repair protein RecF
VHIRQLALTNFRNYVRLGLDLGPGVTVFHGENAQGKSNLLEAVHLLATTRSLRAASERELVHWRALESRTPFARVEARVAREAGELHVELLTRAELPEGGASVDSLRANGSGPTFGKTIKVNGLPSRAAQFVGQINVVLFSPEDVALAAGPPAGRRRYLDITNSQVSPGYLRALQRYNRVLVQRNQLLRQIRERRQPRDLLAPWNDEQVALGSIVLGQRLNMMAGLNAVVGERFRQLSGSHQHLEVSYRPTSVSTSYGSGETSLKDLETAFRVRLGEVATRELEQAVSLVGPHRDDFGFLLDGMDVGTYGSRGQQRLVVLALKLAEVDFMQAETAERPILLLDDVLSELDPSRRAFVLEQIVGQGQTLITTTNLDDLLPGFRARTAQFRVAAGTVEAAGLETAARLSRSGEATAPARHTEETPSEGQ